MAKVDTYTIVGTSVLNGVLTYRFANRSASGRASILKANDHTDINLFDITNGKTIVAMSKDEAIKWLHAHQPKVCKHEKYGAAVIPAQRGAGGGGGGLKKLKKDVESLTETKAPTKARMAAALLYIKALAEAIKSTETQLAALKEEYKTAGGGVVVAEKAAAAPKKAESKKPSKVKIPPAEQLPPATHDAPAMMQLETGV